MHCSQDAPNRLLKQESPELCRGWVWLPCPYPQLCAQVSSLARVPSKCRLQEPQQPQPLRPSDSVAWRQGAGCTDHKARLSQAARRDKCPLSEPRDKAKAGSSGPQCGRQVTPGTRKYFRGYFYLENILPRGVGAGGRQGVLGPGPLEAADRLLVPFARVAIRDTGPSLASGPRTKWAWGSWGYFMGAPALLKLTVWPRAGPRPSLDLLSGRQTFLSAHSLLDSAGHQGLCDGPAAFVCWAGHLTKQEDSELGKAAITGGSEARSETLEARGGV